MKQMKPLNVVPNGFCFAFCLLEFCMGRKNSKHTVSIEKTLWRFSLQMNITFNSSGGPDLTLGDPWKNV